MNKKYLNLKGQKMNLQIERYSTIPISIGIGLYEDSIAEKFPSILKLIKEVKVEKIEFEEEIVVENKVNVDEVKKVDENLELVDKEPEEVKNVSKELNYDDMTYQELKALIKTKKIEIDGRNSIKKMRIALELNNK